jgi:hypothetical protein
MMVIGFAAALWANPFMGGWRGVWPFLQFSLFAFTTYMTWHEIRHKSAGRIVLALVRVGVCASCGYSLEGLRVEDDGCAVCPECGAAWKVQTA